jgi:hypothetical protein
MAILEPILTILPPQQLQLWPELDATPQHFTLYGGTALALRFGHRASADFDFFSNQPFDLDELVQTIPYLKEAEPIQVAPNTLKCRVERGGPVLISFFGNLRLGQVAPRDQVQGRTLFVASALDVAGMKVAVVQKRAEAKDYIDIDALLQHGVDLPTALAAGRVIYGRSFNPLITLKALCYFDDLPALPVDIQTRLRSAVAAVDLAKLPELTPYTQQPLEMAHTP